jgi:hypothetical protein
LKTQDQVPILPDDEFLSSIVESDAAVDEATELTFGVLQQSLLQKIPVCSFAKLGGDDGMRLAKSAFAVLLKFSESIQSFQNLS